MLPKRVRLNLSREFKQVASGVRKETTHLVVFIKQEPVPDPLIGIAVSKRNFGTASARNRVKRLVATAVQNLYSGLPNHLKVVIMPKAHTLEVSGAQLEQELAQALNV